MDGKALVREVFEVIGSGDYDRIPRLIHLAVQFGTRAVPHELG